MYMDGDSSLFRFPDFLLLIVPHLPPLVFTCLYTAAHKLMNPGGECATARACAEAGKRMSIVRHGGGGNLSPFWWQQVTRERIPVFQVYAVAV